MWRVSLYTARRNLGSHRYAADGLGFGTRKPIDWQWMPWEQIWESRWKTCLTSALLSSEVGYGSNFVSGGPLWETLFCMAWDIWAKDLLTVFMRLRVNTALSKSEGSYLHVSLCTACIPGAFGSQKQVSNPLALDLHTIVSHHVDVWNPTQAQVLWKNKCS